MTDKKIPFFFHGILQGRYEDEPAELFGYELFERGFNTFKRSEGKVVMGSLAYVPRGDVDELDRIEGFPSYYVRIQKPVVLEDGTTVIAWVYQQAKDWMEDSYKEMLDHAETI
mgnify:CR=1 FL=1